MNKEIQSIIHNIKNVHGGEPWYGRSIYELLDETDPTLAPIKPNSLGHSLLDLIYHMDTWAEFTLRSIEKSLDNPAELEDLDWRDIDPSKHNWVKGVANYKSNTDKLIGLLEKKDDSFLDEQVAHRKYDFRFLINGFIQHAIYHTGQIAYINKFLV